VAFLASVAFFLLAAAAIPIRGQLVLVLVLGGVYVYVVVAAAKRRGPLYAVPLAIAGGLAFDSFYIPPVRDFGAGDWQNWLVVGIYIGMGVLIGMLGARSQRRAEAAEQAHGLLAEEQAALRRVATLVARQAPAAEVFAKVAEEVRLLLGVEVTTMVRFEHDGTATVVAHSGQRHPAISVGTRLPLERENIPDRAGRPVRLDDYAKVSGAIWAYGRSLGIHFAVGSPIVVEGRLWGLMATASRQGGHLPAGSESRIGEFTQLVATAIANTQARSDLAASRARIVGAADEERRRVVRDLHDGAQQRLVHTVVTLKLAREALQSEPDPAAELVTEALDQAEQATAELRELAHGILPSVLAHGGLRAGVDALSSRMPVPVENGVAVGRLPAAVEATAYFVVAEALTNVAKHARAERVEVMARVQDGALAVHVRDDGVGGARPDGSGLVGLADRLAALDGQLRIESPADGGTLITAVIPLAG
jgi:signal transduction histidine kinase